MEGKHLAIAPIYKRELCLKSQKVGQYIGLSEDMNSHAAITEQSLIMIIDRYMYKLSVVLLSVKEFDFITPSGADLKGR